MRGVPLSGFACPKPEELKQYSPAQTIMDKILQFFLQSYIFQRFTVSSKPRKPRIKQKSPKTPQPGLMYLWAIKSMV